MDSTDFDSPYWANFKEYMAERRKQQEHDEARRKAEAGPHADKLRELEERKVSAYRLMERALADGYHEGRTLFPEEQAAFEDARAQHDEAKQAIASLILKHKG
jgi:hypothetical protein